MDHDRERLFAWGSGLPCEAAAMAQRSGTGASTAAAGCLPVGCLVMG